MTLSKIEFDILAAAAQGCQSLDQVAEKCGYSFNTVKTFLESDEGKICVANSFEITDAGLAKLEPYRVQNAIIMAAGLSSRFAPLSYEKPKGVLEVRGEVLIERQIRQLKEAGINDITVVVVGYMKEAFFYLEDKFGVNIVVNEEYATRNNNSTLMLVNEKLGNTYICSSDDYFTENVFEPYVYEAYYPGVFFKGDTDEYLMQTGVDGRIVGVSVGGKDQYGMLGHVYFDKLFSSRFVQILKEEYDRPETVSKLWEDIFRDHLNELKMVMRPYRSGIIYEFDSLDDLRDFDKDFIENVDSKILDNICEVLKCGRSDIHGIVPIKKGLTNLSFKFVIHGQTYVYRHPGAGTSSIINRRSEWFSQTVANELGIDKTFVYQDKQHGWKISKYIEGCGQLDYHNEKQVAKALATVRKLHRSGKMSEWNFDIAAKTDELIGLLEAKTYPLPSDFSELRTAVSKLDNFVCADGVAPCLCHNDFYSPNILIKGDNLDLIDWEYSAMSDYASDLGTFICCSDYTYDEALQVVSLYFEGTQTNEEIRHCIAYVALAAFYWFVWAMYKESEGDPVGEWLYLWYRSAKKYSEKAIALYKVKN